EMALTGKEALVEERGCDVVEQVAIAHRTGVDPVDVVHKIIREESQKDDVRVKVTPHAIKQSKLICGSISWNTAVHPFDLGLRGCTNGRRHGDPILSLGHPPSPGRGISKNGDTLSAPWADLLVTQSK